MSSSDLAHFSMLDLFRLEVQSQVDVLTTSLLALESDSAAADHLEACMRAAHSLKGAARIVDLDVGVRLTHALEECFVAAQRGEIRLEQVSIDLLLSCVDLLVALAALPEHATGEAAERVDRGVTAFLAELEQVLRTRQAVPSSPPDVVPDVVARPRTSKGETTERVTGVTAARLALVLGLAGESLMATRRLRPLLETALRAHRRQQSRTAVFEDLLSRLRQDGVDERTQAIVVGLQHQISDAHRTLTQQLAEFELHEQRTSVLAQRVYNAALDCRMRAFGDGMRHFPRMVRDLGRALGKPVKLHIVGAATQLDRDILEQLDAPLGHLLRNAVDHGIDSRDSRQVAGKPAEGQIKLEAWHRGGRLQVTVSDDGAGIDLDRIRAAVIERKLAASHMVAAFSESELLDFLLLPGFSMKQVVTEVSGRGVGLDVVHSMIQAVHGTLNIHSKLGEGTRFELTLPLTQSVVRTLLVEIDGEPYAFPLSQIVRAERLSIDRIESFEGRQHFWFEGSHVGLVTAQRILGASLTSNLAGPEKAGSSIPTVIIGSLQRAVGIAVDRFLGEQELFVQPLMPALGKVKDVSGLALLDDCGPVVVLDVEDMLQSVQKLSWASHSKTASDEQPTATAKPTKRILVVDDSLTVRELERKILTERGYQVGVAVDGVDGWNALHEGGFGLIVTDIDMPRMDGIELVKRIRQDLNLCTIPIIVVSYNDREEDQRRGLEAGADHYITKGSFRDDAFLTLVASIIGEPAA